APVPVIVEESAAGVPPPFAVARIGGDAGLLRHVGESAVAVVVPQHAVTPVSDEQVVPAVVVEVAGADALPPTGVRHARLHRDIGKGPVAVVLIEAADGRPARRPLRLEARPVDEEDVEPPVVVVINKGTAAAGSLEQESVPALAAEDRPGAQARLTRDVDEPGGEWEVGDELVESKDGNCGAQRAHE